MPYCTVDDLNDYSVHLDIDEYSDPTDTEVEAIITSIDTEMDRRFAAVGITVPITDSDLLTIVKRVSVYGTLAEVFRAKEMESDRAAEYQELFDKRMEDIRKMPGILQTGTTDTTTPRGLTSRTKPFSRTSEDW